MAYKLKLPPNCSIDPIFHVFMLKKKLEDNISITTLLPQVQEQQVIVAPEKVLQTRTLLKDSAYVQKGLIRWTNLSIKDAT